MRNRLLLLILVLVIVGLAMGVSGGCGEEVKTYRYYYPDWTPDGRIICVKEEVTTGSGFWIFPGPSTSRYFITTMSEEGTQEVDIRAIENLAKAVVFSPLGTSYAYSYYDNEKQCFVIKMIDCKEDNLVSVNLSSEVYGLDWSPDGAKIVFSTPDGIYVANRNGGNLQFLRRGSKPVWRYTDDIVFFSYDEWKIARIGFDGTGYVTYESSGVVISQDYAKNIYFREYVDDYHQRVKMIDYGGTMVVVKIEKLQVDLDYGEPRVNKQGSKMVYYKQTYDENEGLYVFDLDKNTEKRIKAY